MFDQYAKELIDELPKLKNLETDKCRRALSKAYIYILGPKLGVEPTEVEISDINELKITLRKLANLLENICVFDKVNGIEVDEKRGQACAFVAAESISLLLEFYKKNYNYEGEDSFVNKINYLSIEAALLYMVSGYDINAKTIVENINISILDSHLLSNQSIKLNSDVLIENIKKFCLGNLNIKRVDDNGEDSCYEDDYDLLVKSTRIRFYKKLNLAITKFMSWLLGNKEKKAEAMDILREVNDYSISSEYIDFTEYKDIYHMSNLLLAAISEVSLRATVEVIPEPINMKITNEIEFNRYLKYRAKGENSNGRPFIWPSAIEYIKECLPEADKNVVISMPTGSGKSFIAELGIIHSINKGWVLYLTPTNALASQVRRDLKYALKPFKSINIKTFIGGEEYTTLITEEIKIDDNYVVVMTPEKCALALRLYPEKFKNCSLCVFDECHLMNDRKRGITVDILLAQLFIKFPDIRYIFMSAMIDNAEHIANWIEFSSKNKTIAKIIKWRPSRTMRGLLFLEKQDLRLNAGKALEELNKLNESRRKIYFKSKLALVSGLSGPWTKDGPKDYKGINLPINYESQLYRDKNNQITPKFDGWKNGSARELAKLFASNEIPTINFILTSKHHAFSNANKLLRNNNKDYNNLPDIVKAWLTIADEELGVKSVLWDLLNNDIAVHTSSMLQVEQAAAEWMFANRKVNLMFATGTLAQGLNLPAVAVIISGTSMGDPRERDGSDEVYGISRVNSLILNGFGRAGRPGFSNQGIGILVPDKPYFDDVNDQLNPKKVLSSYDVLSEPDAAIIISSPIEKFIENIMEESINTESATEDELILISLLSELNDQNSSAAKILNVTFGGYKQKEKFSKEFMNKIDNTFNQIKENFLENNKLPTWINTASMKSGTEFFKVKDMWMAYEKIYEKYKKNIKNYNIIDWLNIFFEVIALLPPRKIEHYLPDDSLKRETVLTNMRDLLGDYRYVDELDWNIPDKWNELWKQLMEIVILYLRGKSYADIAKQLFKIDYIDNKRSSGSQPIPAIFKFIKEIIEPLSIDAGCFLAINEYGIFSGDKDKIPESLQALPICIRNGCDTLETLAWYRFGIRERISAHFLSDKYNIPVTMNSDKKRAEWVKGKRKEWLKDKKDEDVRLNSIKTIILEGKYN